MICAQHEWWDDEAPCPRCAPIVTATETDLVSVPSAAAGAFDLTVPDFLKRNPDGTFAHPECKPCTDAPSAELPTKPHTSDATTPVVWTAEIARAASEQDLNAALNSEHLSCLERQPIYMELRDREDRVKSRARINEMLTKKAAKSASKDGAVT